jgi:hypothetical protein
MAVERVVSANYFFTSAGRPNRRNRRLVAAYPFAMDDHEGGFELVPYEFLMQAPALVPLLDGTTAIVCHGDTLWGFEGDAGLVFAEHNRRVLN